MFKNKGRELGCQGEGSVDARIKPCRASATEMIPILAVNVVLILLIGGIASGILPAKACSGAVAVLHKTIGISLPLPGKERMIAVLWIASLLAIGDGILFLLLFLTTGIVRG